jgi:glycosyltransferase involved in cell wall biosynthesis
MTEIDVTAVIPAFNEELYVARAIESVLSQTVKPKQILVVDDGSTDETASIVERYRKDGVEYKYQENGGLASARNTGIRMARGKYVGFLDSDDEWRSSLMEDMKVLFERHPNLAWACAPYERLFENGEIEFVRSVNDRLVSNGLIDNYFEAQRESDFSCSSCIVIRRDVFAEVGGFDTTISEYGEDLDMWFRIALNYPNIGYCSRIGAAYWRKAGSITGTSPRDVGRALRRIHKSESHALFLGGAALEKCEPLVLHWVWSQTKEAAVQSNKTALQHISRFYGRRLPLGKRLALDVFRMIPLGYFLMFARKIFS